jgi:hypothetical protein
MKYQIYLTFLSVAFFNTCWATAQESPEINPFKHPPHYVRTNSGLRPDTPRPESPAKLPSVDCLIVIPEKPNKQ